jgi:hypothetical protein
VREVSDSFLLQVAEVSGGLFGLFMVGMLFWAETGFRALGREREVVVPYFRASTWIVLLLFSIPLGVSLTLVVLEPAWSRALYALLSLLLVATNVGTAIRIRSVHEVTSSRVLQLNEIAGTIAVVVIVALPWILGGIDPSREDLTWGILVAFAAAFLSLAVTVISVFDLVMSPGEGAGR